MDTYKIHITGIVQGVGFRPLVYNLAKKLNIKGTVSNNNQGVIIHCNTCDTCAETFLNLIKTHPPTQAVITYSSIEKSKSQEFKDFSIVYSQNTTSGKLLITPDYAICSDCLNDLEDVNNSRYNYPFITCTSCGPRYSIIRDLPYDRILTTMHKFVMCETCKTEYQNPEDRRFYSQTNSCPKCGITQKLFETNNTEKPIQIGNEISASIEALEEGRIIAIKGIGGYLLLADASRIDVIEKLRERKQRPSKPFALMMYDDQFLQQHCSASEVELAEWNSSSASIILFDVKPTSILPVQLIAPGLKQVGVMKAYTPLHSIICKQFKKPLIATSANLTDSPIIYTDNQALQDLTGIADFILTNNREILVPQDDSVLRFTRSNQKITIRRSRGIAPNYFSNNTEIKPNILAVGAMLKSAFALTQNDNIFISQYLGATNSYDTQKAFDKVYKHLSNTLQFEPQIILADKHPGYFSTEWAEELALKKRAKLHSIQHHEAHFCAVIGENSLWNEKVLGFIWDGTGFGSDHQIWGGETMVYSDGLINRTNHLPYHKHILGDKMVNEPRISALSFFGEIKDAQAILTKKFTDTENKVFKNQIQTSKLNTSSMGRLFDAVSSILDICNKSNYHGEAAMLLEAHADSYGGKYSIKPYPVNYNSNKLELNLILTDIMQDVKNGLKTNLIAAKFHQTLAEIVFQNATALKMKNIAFSGGVFQNKLLVEILQQKLHNDFNLFFHQQLSPNDECISYGQLMHFHFMNKCQ